MADLKTKPGDFFAIPAHNPDCEVGFVMARHIALEYDVPIVEVFRRFYTTPPASLADVDTTTRLFRPVMMLLDFGKGSIPTVSKWQILFEDPDYNRNQSNFDSIQIGYPYDADDACRIREGGKDRIATKAEALLVENSTWWLPHHISARVTAHLAGLIGPTEQYSDWKITGLPITGDDDQEQLAAYRLKLAAAINDSQLIASRLKQWAKEKVKNGNERSYKPKSTGCGK